MDWISPLFDSEFYYVVMAKKNLFCSTNDKVWYEKQTKNQLVLNDLGIHLIKLYSDSIKIVLYQKIQSFITVSIPWKITKPFQVEVNLWLVSTQSYFKQLLTCTVFPSAKHDYFSDVFGCWLVWFRAKLNKHVIY